MIDIVTLASFSISGYVTVDLLLEFLTVVVGAFLWICMKMAGGITGAGDHMTKCKRTVHIRKIVLGTYEFFLIFSYFSLVLTPYFAYM